MDLKDLYRDVIVDHNRNPRNFGSARNRDRRADGFNPLCGDRLTVFAEARQATASPTLVSRLAAAPFPSPRLRC